MLIKKKVDIDSILDNFESISQWDVAGNKHYLIFQDRNRGGQWTLMKYKIGGQFSVHGLGEDYSDEGELYFDSRDFVASFLWDNRSAYNAAVKKISTLYSVNY